MDDSFNCISHWFPPLLAAGLPVPETRIVRPPAGCDLTPLLDGVRPAHWDLFQEWMRDAARSIGHGGPVFLRTGYGSGKHDWRRTCYVADPEVIGQHVGALVEWSALVDLKGLPTDVWAVRKLIATEPLFYAFEGMPITREFRFFVRDCEIVHAQPYWPPDAIVVPDADDWRERLIAASFLHSHERARLEVFVARACGAVGGGYWSVDMLEDADGGWWITDMADGERSFRWEYWDL